METAAVHMVGAGLEEFRAPARYMEISHLLPALRQLNLVLIGPALKTLVPALTDATDAYGFVVKSPEAENGTAEDRCAVVLEAIPSTYEAYLEKASAAMQRPTLVVGMHSGAEDPAFRTEWAPALRALLQMGFPCLFTGYNMQESQDLERSLRETYRAEITTSATRNPFRGLCPFPDQDWRQTGENFYYTNGAFVQFKGVAAAD